MGKREAKAAKREDLGSKTEGGRERLTSGERGYRSSVTPSAATSAPPVSHTDEAVLCAIKSERGSAVKSKASPPSLGVGRGCKCRPPSG